MKNRKTISVVIPCYKSENTIAKVVDDLIFTIEDDGRFNYEIILINDGSKDNTYSVISQLAIKNKNIISINLAKNFGQSSAIIAGYSKVNGDYVVTMDDDGEHNPKEIFKLVDKLEYGYDYVCAEFVNYHHSLYKRIGSKFNYWFLTKMMDIPNGSILSSYNICRRFVIDEILKYTNPKPYVDGMVWAITNNTATVKIEHNYRLSGKSGYNLINSISLWLNGVTSYSIKPLRLASFFGFVCAVVGFIFGVFTVIDKIIHPDITIGWTSLFSTLLFISGFLMIFLGLIGEYVGRSYLISNHIPQYVIREEIKKGKKYDRI